MAACLAMTPLLMAPLGRPQSAACSICPGPRGSSSGLGSTLDPKSGSGLAAAQDPAHRAGGSSIFTLCPASFLTTCT